MQPFRQKKVAGSIVRTEVQLQRCGGAHFVYDVYFRFFGFEFHVSSHKPVIPYLHPNQHTISSVFILFLKILWHPLETYSHWENYWKSVLSAASSWKIQTFSKQFVRIFHGNKTVSKNFSLRILRNHKVRQKSFISLNCCIARVYKYFQLKK